MFNLIVSSIYEITRPMMILLVSFTQHTKPNIIESKSKKTSEY